MKISTTQPRALIPAGEHLLYLSQVEIKLMKNNFKAKPSDPDEVDRMIWQFLSKATNPESGEPYEYAVFTGLQYGDSRAAMTKLLDQIVPGITIDAAAEFDTDEVVERWYRARIKHVKDGQGIDRAEHTLIEPYTKTAAAKPAEAAPAPKRPIPPLPPDEQEEPADPFQG